MYLNRREEGWIGIAVVCLLAVGVALVVAIAYEPFSRQSERFSKQSFRQIEEGMPLAEAVEILGEPVESATIPPDWRQWPGQVHVHRFSGQGTAWWPFYTSAALYTDDHGVITAISIHDEP